MSQRVHKGDTVQVLSGKDRGKKGKVQSVLGKEGRLVIEGVNLAKRHIKARPGVRQAGVVSLEAPLHISKVMVVCPRCNRPARIGVQLLQDGRKVRICRKCKEAIE